MAPWPGISSTISDQYRKYLQPKCFTNYDNFQKEIKRQITTLSNRDQKSFCTNCQTIRQDIINKNNKLNDCFTYNVLRNKLINDDDINAFMEKCLEQPKCSYSGASNVRSPPAFKGKQEKTCRGSNDCNRVATLVKESAGKVKPEIKLKSPEPKLPISKEDLNITQPPAEGAGSTKANTNSGPQNNTPNPNDLVVARPGVSDPKVIYPSGTTRHESIPKPAASASLNSLTSALGSSSNDSSSRITLGTDSSTTAIAQQQNLGTSSHESDQHSPQHVNSNPLSAQDIGSRTSQDQDTDERSHNGKDAAVITLGDGNPGTEVISNLLEGIADLGGLPRLHNKITDAAA
ncbi:PIR protein, partial [Plasmodium vivax]